MTVLDRLIYLTSTGFTGTYLILGTHLQNIMKLILKDLSENDNPKYKLIRYEDNEDFYSTMFYHELWEVVMRPIIAKYLAENIPNGWFNKFYSSTNLTLQ